MNGAREIRRLRYLQAMGLPVFVAHRPLPGAAPTRKLLLKNPPAAAARAASAPEPGAATRGRAQSVATGSATATQKSAPTTAATDRAAALRESLQAAPQAKVPAPVPQRPAGPRPAQPQTQRFSLAAMLCADRLWLEELEDALLAQDQVQLVGALARALLHPEPLAKKPVVTQFDWPLHGNQQLDLGPDEAAASLQGFLLRQLEENRCVELVCLGEAAAERLRGLRLPCALRRLPSSRDVLENPHRKRELWAALRN
jgi:hypothetical protein